LGSARHQLWSDDAGIMWGYHGIPQDEDLMGLKTQQPSKTAYFSDFLHQTSKSNYGISNIFWLGSSVLI
jgi:hypothetical protein